MRNKQELGENVLNLKFPVELTPPSEANNLQPTHPELQRPPACGAHADGEGSVTDPPFLLFHLGHQTG